MLLISFKSMISSLNPRFSFISSVLPETAQHLQEGVGLDAVYKDTKGYLAEADIVANDFLVDQISQSFPDDLILSEEIENTASLGRADDVYVWIIDPICGTTNYLRNIPFYVHSVCVLNDEGVLYAGIYDSNRNELFLADRRQTTLNGENVRVSEIDNLGEAVVAVNCNQSDVRVGRASIETIVGKFAPPVTRRVKIFESANLELAYVACGRLDAYLNPNDRVWDIAAGSLMIHSAGGLTSIMNGSINPLEYNVEGVVGSNNYLMEPLLQNLK